MAIFIESEIWPSYLHELSNRQIPAALVNARMTAGSLESWLSYPKFSEYLFSNFSFVQAADKLTAEGLQKLGVKHLSGTNNLKAALTLPSINGSELNILKRMTKFRPVWLAASTHAGEEAMAIRCQMQLLKQAPDCLLIIAPRHPERRDSILKALNLSELDYAIRSAGDQIMPSTEIYLADSFGEMSLWYGLAELTFLGGSLVPGIGGHNPFEPAQLGCPIVTGPHYFNFNSIFNEMSEAGAIQRVENEEELTNLVETLLLNEMSLRKKLREKAKQFCARYSTSTFDSLADQLLLL